MDKQKSATSFITPISGIFVQVCPEIHTAKSINQSFTFIQMSKIKIKTRKALN